ncbi:MAG: Hsp70 family protein, partial [Rhodococcus sp.]|nr:Hsp70 family protein [Rhodococcus sp. (in: high G+C Gram-positive bacteria)]
CEKSGFSGEGALQVRCLISPDSSLGKAIGMERTDYQSVTAWRDDQYARSNFIRLRDNKSDGHTKIVSADGNRIIDFDPDETYYVYFTVIDRSTGAILQFSMDTVDLGMTFLTELELADA